jgi:hypothetical protein
MNPQNPEGNFCILILSCDKYSDLWQPFLQQFFKFFPYENVPIYLGSNTKNCLHPGVKSILSGDDIDWSSSYLKILGEIKERKILVILDDLFITSKVVPEMINSVKKFSLERDSKFIRCWANPFPPDARSNARNIGIVDKGAPYRVTVCGIWDRNTLMELLIPGESPWEFEVFASYRSSYMDGFYATYEPIVDVINAVEKGAWMPGMIQKCKELRIPIIRKCRPEQKNISLLKSWSAKFIFNSVSKVPWRYRVRSMNFLRKIFATY